MCNSPKLIAAYHVLHRLIDPRHSPYALTCFKKVYSVLDLRTISKVQRRRPLAISYSRELSAMSLEHLLITNNVY